MVARRNREVGAGDGEQEAGRERRDPDRDDGRLGQRADDDADARDRRADGEAAQPLSNRVAVAAEKAKLAA